MSDINKIIIFDQQIPSSSGVTDHTLLSNIGVKTHTTLDSEVDANTAKTGITETQASDIIANNAKVSYDDTDVLKDADTLSLVTGTNKLMTQYDVAGLGGGDMLKSTYDTNSNNIVDDSEKLGGQLPSYYAPQSGVTQNTIDIGTNVTDILSVSANTITNAGDISSVSADTITNSTDISTNASDISSVSADTITNNAKTGITETQASDIIANNAKVGISTQQASDITDNNTKISYTDASAVALNTAKTGITETQASDILVNNAKTGITETQASDIITNNAKVGITTQQASDIVTNNAKTGITATQASDIIDNNAKVSYTDSAAVALNTTKTGITATQASDIITNNSKTGITETQASNIITNNAKTGITETQASDIILNNAKVTYDDAIIVANTASGLDSHSGDTNIHYTQGSISITESQISDLQDYSLTGHTHVIADITDFTDNSTEWDIAYNDSVTGMTVTGTTSKTITLFQQDGGLIQANFTDEVGVGAGNDYVTSGDFNTSTGDVTLTRLSGGTVVYNLDGRYSTGSTSNTDDFVTGATFNIGDGVLEFTTQSGSTFNVDLDGRYITSETDSQILSWDGTPNELTISNGNTVAITGFSENGHTHLEADITDLQDYSLQANLVTHSGDTSIHFTEGSISITESQISDLGTYLTGYTETDPVFVASQANNITGTDITNLSNLSGTNTGDQDLSGYALTGHTHTASDVTDFDTEVSNNTDVVANIAKTGITETQASDIISNNAKVTDLVHPLVETAVPVGALFTDTVYNDTAIQAEVDLNTVKTGITETQSSDIILNNAKTGITETQASDILANNAKVTYDDAIIVANTASGLDSHSGDTTIHFTEGSISITESQVSDLKDYSLQTDLVTHSGDTSIHFTQGSISITESQISDLQDYSLTGHTHLIADITDFTDNSTEWDIAYDDSITGMTVTGTGTKTITLEQRDGGTVTANFTDISGGGAGSGDVVTGMTFNTSDGVLTLTTLSGVTITEDLDDRYPLETTFDAHTGDTTNPHVVTQTQVGLSNVDNTSDADKPVSTATQTALDLKTDDTQFVIHTGDTANPHSVTQTQVGLSDVDNTSDANKPVSTATQTALDLKTDDTQFVIHTGDTANPHTVTATQVGLGNVDDTSDADKPISTATQTALDTKALQADLVTHSGDTNIHYTQGSISITESQISDLQDYSLTGHTHTASDVTDFDTEVSNNTDVVANTAKTGITTTQASDIILNNAKTGITETQASDILANNAKVTDLVHPLVETAVPSGAVFTDTVYDDTTIQAEVDLNTAKTGITETQASDILLNNAKVGISTQQASDIVTNNAKTGITETQASDILINNAKTGITETQASDIITNNAKVTDLVHPLVEEAVPSGALFTDTLYNDTAIQAEVDLNTAKTGITATQSADILANNAKVTDLVHPLVETAVPIGAVFTDTDSLSGLTDTNITTPTDDQVLTWDTATSKWIPQSVSGATATYEYSGTSIVPTQVGGYAVNDNYSFIGGGQDNTNSDSFGWSVISGGQDNTATDSHTFIGGGWTNSATNIYAVVAGGRENIASGTHSFIGGGWTNATSGHYGNISGGFSNIVTGDYGTVLGGHSMEANSFGEIVGGLYGTIISGNTTTFVGTDRLFVLGNGTSVGSRSNAFTILKNGLATLPSVTNLLISGNTKSIITKEYGDANYLGNMLKSIYDTNDSGIVDNAETVNSLTVETAVPSGALFTDTVYNDTAIQAEVDLNTAKTGITATQASDILTNNAKVTDLVHPLVETAVPVGALFTDTIYDDTSFNTHTGDTLNPHAVSLEQARAQANILSGDIDFNNNNINNLTDLNFTNGGPINWNTKYHTINVPTGDGSINKVGLDTMFDVHNATGGTLLKGTVVYPNGTSTLGVSNVSKAIADTHVTISSQLGVIAHDILDGDDGHVMVQGVLDPINTTGFTEGPIYLSATIAGTLTSVKPLYPNYEVLIGVVDSVGISGVTTIDIAFNLQNTLSNFWNGTFRESFEFKVSVSGATITGTFTPKNGNVDTTMILSDGFSLLDTSPGATVELIAGTDTIPQMNYVYIPQSTKVLTVSTSGFPATEHIRVAEVFLQSAANTLSLGALKNHNFNDHIQGSDNQGHLTHITERLRTLHATWDSGTEGSAIGLPANLYVQVTGGVVYQLHKQQFPSSSMPTDDIHIINDFTTPYLTLTDLKGITSDALGTSLGDSSFSLVIWGVANKTGERSHIMCNLPIGTYSKNTPELAISDSLGNSVYTIPRAFRGTGFLIARFTFKINNTVWTLEDTEDLRGKSPNTSAGGISGGGSLITSFLGLLDTPTSFAGQGGTTVKVNSTEDALEFVPFTGLTIDDIGVTVQGYNVDTVIDSAYVHTDNNFTTIYKNEVDVNTAKTGITITQASDIIVNNAKTGITETQASDILVNNAKTGITITQASDIIVNNAKTGITITQASDIIVNNAKTGITETQASDIISNNAKVTDLVHPLVETAVPVGALFTDTDSLSGLTDTTIGVTPTDNQVLSWDTATGKWIPQIVAGGGDVAKVGTPLNNEIGVWTGDGTLEGISGFTMDSSVPSVRALDIGVDDTVNGVVNIYGSTTNVGGLLRLYNGANADSDDDSYTIKAGLNILEIGGSNTSVFFKYNSPTQKITLESDTIGFTTYGGGTISGTTTYLAGFETDGSIVEVPLPLLVNETTPKLGAELDAQDNTIGFTLQEQTGVTTTTNINWTLGNKAKFTFGAGNETLTFTAPSKPTSLLLLIVQDVTGSRTITWPTIKWLGGTAPTLSTLEANHDMVALFYDGTNYYGSAGIGFF